MAIENRRPLSPPCFHHRPLPDRPAHLAGSQPPADEVFVTEPPQLWSSQTAEMWRDPAPHHHTASDEICIVLRGAIVVEVDGERVSVAADESCAFPAGVVYSVAAVDPTVRSRMIRAPSVADTVYLDEDETRTNYKEQDRP